MSKLSNEQICAAVLTNGSIKNAAAVLKVSERTIYNAMHNTEFKELYKHTQADILNGAVISCQNRLVEAIDVISDIMNDKTVNAQTRLMAAQSLLKNAVALYETKETIRNSALSESESIWKL